MEGSKSSEAAGDLLLAIAAATAAGCVTCVLGGFVHGIISWIIEGGSGDGLLGYSLYVGIVGASGALVVCPVMFVIAGLPLYALSRRKRWVTAPVYAAVAFVISAAVAVALKLSDFSIWYDFDFGVPATIIGGTVATLVFWKVARPDRSAE